MAWAFQLSVECGESEAAERVGRHFDGVPWELSDGTLSTSGASPHQDTEGNWWAIVCPSGVSRGGVSSEAAAAQLSEVGRLLYARLRTSPQFRYALVGVESEDFRLFSELGRDLVELPFYGLVIRREICKNLGSPSVFVSFEPGYMWRPYEGESTDRR